MNWHIIKHKYKNIIVLLRWIFYDVSVCMHELRVCKLLNFKNAHIILL